MKQNLIDIDLLKNTTDDVACNCKGQIYKYYTNIFMNKRGHWVHEQRMMLQKRMSCKNDCARCYGLLELLEELPYNAMLTDKLVSGKYYVLKYNAEEPSYYSCGDESVYPEFVKLM